MPKFSIITPVRLGNGPQDRPDRLERFKACIESVSKQTFRDFEWVVVNDGSPADFNWSDELVFNNGLPSVNLISKEHGERVIAYNTALKAAKGDWILFLDSDDELKSNSLKRINDHIEIYPNFKMFNFGCIYQHKDGQMNFRDPFVLEKKGKGHIQFGGGNIVNGTFVFHRSVYEKEGGFPGDEEGFVRNVDCTEINYGGIRDLYMGSPYDFSAAMQLKYPELREYFMVDHVAEPNKIIKELGNPWGQDFALWYHLTRNNRSRVIKEHLLIVNPK